jgi:transcription elongation factor Elf1
MNNKLCDPMLNQIKQDILGDIELLQEDVKRYFNLANELEAPYDNGTVCPSCGCTKSDTTDTRKRNGTQMRRRQCKNCGERWTTFERRVESKRIDHGIERW